MHFKPMRVDFSVEEASTVESLPMIEKEAPIWSISECQGWVEGVSVFARALQSHDHEGSSRQLLVNEEHESSSEDCLQQLGFKAFVESHNSKTPKRKEVRKKNKVFKEAYYFAKAYS